MGRAFRLEKQVSYERYNIVMSKIVYHGTVSSGAPHVWGSPFHAGTLRAANERLDDEIEHGVAWDAENKGILAIGIGQIHAYEISDDAPTSRKVWEDPMFSEDESKAVPEHKENRIYPYKNEREDKGLTSYVIPSSFVGTHVKHLNTTQFLINADKEQESSIMGAISTMAGGPFKR